MNKRTDNNLSTSRILKSKYQEQEKQKTIPLINRSTQMARLLDLCPEQKLKIGQLIKALQTRKQQNEYLSQQLDQLTQKYRQADGLLRQNMVRLQLKESRQRELLSEISQCNQKLRIKEQLLICLQQDAHRNKPNLQSRLIGTQISVQTSIPQMKGTSTQTKTKKPKAKHCQVQVNITPAPNSLFYRAHSKSFQKIMKASLPPERLNHHQLSRIITTQRLTQKKYQGSSLQRQSSPSVHDFQSQSEYSPQILAEKWKQLKQKHQTVSPMCSSFGIKQLPRKRQGEDDSSSQKWISLSKNMSKFEQYDELQLNKLLKSKKFSAHKLIRPRQSSSKKSKGKMSPEVNYLKSPCFNNEQGSLKKMGNLSPSEKDINFFQSDILEIAQSLNE